MKSLLSLLISIIMSLSIVAFAGADYLTCDHQPSEMVTKYQIDLNGETFPADIENVGEDQVRLYYNIDHLDNGKHVVSAQAGNDEGEWSLPSNVYEFYRGVPTPQNIGLYCVAEDPQRLSRDGFSVYHVNAQQNDFTMCAEKVLDGNANTEWQTTWATTDPDAKHPHEIQIELGRQYTISGFYILPRQDENWNGTISKFKFYTSLDGAEWIEVASGKLLKVKEEQFVEFNQVAARYISLVALSEVNSGPWTTVAELNILGY